MNRYIAILDDAHDRCEQMQTRLEVRFPVTVRTFPKAEEIIHWLDCHQPETILMSLNDNLLEDPSAHQAPGTGLDVVDFLAERTPNCPVVVHAANARVSEMMCEKLKTAGWNPIPVVPLDDLGWTDQEWLDEEWFPRVRRQLHALPWVSPCSTQVPPG